MAMFNFDDLNAAIENAKLPSDWYTLQSAIELRLAALAVVRPLPSAYSDEYVKVQRIQYDQQARPEDVTPVENLSVATQRISAALESLKEIQRKEANLQPLPTALAGLLSELPTVSTLIDAIS